MMVKGRNSGNTKDPSPCRRNQILCSLNHCQDITIRKYTKLKSYFLPLEGLNMGNDDLSTNSKYDDCSNINFLLHHALNQVDSNTNILDKVIVTEVVLRQTKNSRSVGPHKSKSKKNGNKKKSCLKNKKFRSVNKSFYGIRVDFDSDDDYVPQQRLLYTNKDKRNYPLINTGTSIPIIAWKLTKNQSYIISDISIPGRLPHSRLSQRFKLNDNSPNMSGKDIGLVYRTSKDLYSQEKLLDQTYLLVYHT